MAVQPGAVLLSYRYDRFGRLARHQPPSPPAQRALVVPLLVTLAILTGASGQANLPNSLRACIDTGHRDPFAAEAVFAGFKAAGKHILEGNCLYVTDCQRLLAAPVNLTYIPVSTGESSISAALGARECHLLGGDLFVPHPNTNFEAVIPYNVANGVATMVTERSSIPAQFENMVLRYSARKRILTRCGVLFSEILRSSKLRESKPAFAI